MKLLIEIPEIHKRLIDNLVTDGKGYMLPYAIENRLAIAVSNGIKIINCKDCKYNRQNNNNDCKCDLSGVYHDNDYFCANGERR